MSTIAVLPMKSLDRAKSRLSGAVAHGHRRALAEAMYSDVLVAARRTPSLKHVVVVTADHTAARIAGEHDAIVVDDTAGSHSDAAMLGIAQARALEATRVLLIPGDCPLLDPAEIEALLAFEVPARSALIVADRHGTGTNALLLTPPDALTPAFGEGSRQRHLELATAQGTAAEVVEVPTLALDVDTPEDFQQLRVTLEATRGRAANTRGLLLQLDRNRII